ncbi:hypothetical protein BD847_3742 [Flavobacterium cutihirudinis]|uniref:Heavy-metal-associated domain-containing protein n=1 Tax=Flavobacterium cutihirudinis TaxID=1265740 RepID=A0A3D9FK46_9FLAO|nr:hypothetical protein [Flavobacterium cutihirudinis]RED19458.1 hypothetical protein BD847_3742 [Flavobacterium cutihirudinis]
MLTKKVHILFLVLSFGFFLMSNAGHACGKSAEKNSCEKKMNPIKDSCQKDCCKKTKHSKEGHGCSGKCDHSSCTTSGLQFIILTSNDLDLQNNVFNFSLKNTISSYSNSTISSGFTSIWLKPKI